MRTDGCLECLEETGECTLCEGYSSTLIDGKCLCDDGNARYYDATSYTWVCKNPTDLVVPEISFVCEDAS